MSHGNSSSSQAQVDAAMEANRNPLWELAEAIHCDDARSLLKFQPLGETDSRDLSNNNEPPVEKIYAMLQNNIAATNLHDAILIVAVSFNRVAIARTILAVDAANGVEWSTSHERALDAACTNGHLEVATVIACVDEGQVSSMLDQSLAFRYYCLAGDMEHARELLTSDSPDVTIQEALFDACRNGRCDIVAFLTADARFDASVDGAQAFQLTCANGHIEVVSLLLHHACQSIENLELKDALGLAAKAGHCDVVALLVQDPRVNPGLDKSFALECYCLAGDVKRVKEALADPDFVAAPVLGVLLTAASFNGHEGVVKLLLADPRVDPAADNNFAIRNASIGGHEGVVKLLLADPRVDPAVDNNIAIMFASRRGDKGVVELLLADPKVDPTSDDNNNFAIQGACRGGHEGVVKLLLADPRVDPAADDNEAIRHASSNGHASVVKLLLADPRVDPTARDNDAIREASRAGHESVVKLLLADPRVDPSADGNAAIRNASVFGHHNVVKLLLKDPRVDPGAEDNIAIRDASAFGHASVVEVLLADQRVDPGADDNDAIRNASYGGRDSVVKLLLADPRVDPAAWNSLAIRDASSNGHLSVVKLLLADARVDPTALHNYAIRRSSHFGHQNVVNRLLKDPRVDPGANDNIAIRDASANGHASVVELLLADQRVDPSMGHPTALERASGDGHVSIVQMLLRHPQVVVTEAVLIAADERHHGDIIRLLIEKQPRVLQDLFKGATRCISGGALANELRQWQKASVLTFLLAVERFGECLRVSDVLREVMVEYACFDLIEKDVDDSSSIASDEIW